MHTNNMDREKSSGQAIQFNVWTIWAMDRTSAQPQVNLSLLHGNSECGWGGGGGDEIKEYISLKGDSQNIMGTPRIQMKGVLPWLFCRALHAGIKKLLSCLSCSGQASTKYFFPHHTLFQSICPHLPASWARQSCRAACLKCVSLVPSSVNFPFCLLLPNLLIIYEGAIGQPK